MSPTRKPARRAAPTSHEVTSSSDWLHNPDIFVFAGDQPIPAGAAQRHSISEWMGNLFGRRKEDVEADWERVISQMTFLVDKVSAAAQGYQLEEVTFELGFSAEGEIVFIAKGGVTASISATFKRKP